MKGLTNPSLIQNLIHSSSSVKFELSQISKVPGMTRGQLVIEDWQIAPHLRQALNPNIHLLFKL